LYFKNSIVSANWSKCQGRGRKLDIFGVFIGAAGVFLAIFFYSRTRKIKRIGYAVRTFELFSDRIGGIDGLSIQYLDKPVTNLTAGKILLKNTGNDVIHDTDIAKANPLKVSVPNGVEILKIGIIDESTTENRFEIKKINDTTSYVYFDYFAPNDGCVLFVLHSGNREQSLTIDGTLKGGVFTSGYSRDISKYRDTLRWFMPILATPIIADAILIFLRGKSIVTRIMLDTPWILVFYSLIMITVMFGLFFITKDSSDSQPLIGKFRRELDAVDFT